MAGIGFALKKLAEQDNLTGRSLAAGHAIFASSGPWLVTIVGLALLSYIGLPILGAEQIKVFRILVVYSFAISLVVTAPIAMGATLRVSDLLYSRRFDQVQAVYLSALLSAAAAAFVAGAILMILLPGLPQMELLGTLLSMVQIALLWVAIAFVTAIKQYATVTFAFVLGLIFSAIFACIAALAGLGPGGMLIGFSAGLGVTFSILNQLILEAFPGRTENLIAGIVDLIKQSRRSAVLILAGLLGALTLWIDKLVVWHSSEAEVVAQGLVLAPRYDSPLFIAYLSVVPATAVLFIWLESTFFVTYRQYQDIVHSGGTLRQIDDQREALARGAVNTVFAAFLVQLGVSAALAILSPLIVRFFDFPYSSLSVMRLVFVGAAFQFLFQASCGVILFVQHGRAYLGLQIVFLVLNGVLTAAVISRPDYLGLGYVGAAMVSGVLAYYSMVRTLRTLNYLTFIETNSALHAR